MNFKKNVATILTGITLASMPAMVVSANGMPKNSSNYWNKVRYIKVNKNISAVQRTVKNNSIQPKINKKMTVKKGSILVVDRLKNSHNEWLLLNGLKNSKNSVWSTNQKNTNWMSKYTPKKVDNTSKLVTLTKKINITEKTVKNHQIQNKTLKKSSLKKGSIVYVKSFGGNEWLVYGNNMPKTNKNGAWVTNNKGTKWMKNYTPKPAQSKLVKLTKEINIIEKGVKNNTIQNNAISKNKLQAGMIVYVKPLSIYNDEWLVYGNNIPKGKNNGVWVTYNKNQKWMQEPKTVKSNYKTVNNSEIGNDYTDAYLSGALNGNDQQVIVQAGQKIQAKKLDDNTEAIKVNNKEYSLKVKDNQFATQNNVYIFQNGNVGSLYAPDDDNAVVTKDYQPKDNSQWRQILPNNQMKIFSYSAQKNGWIDMGTFNTKQ
ncbi:hypothetical protein [Apilactobacillus timberlakei]|uniref:Surface layer protein A domain-containing protein n=1 Tax=Apilactobacillus timberlakei TaxID=2008380 RepID=A0ABY2YSG6_9LACO|nr:hypothetical protein [Apilactobacillus timberlakei]TPR14182.1 hypothetical protein DY048_04345 [Apilactobacillus timberlakei]TPR16435.1 hypothetical protein DY052_02435 [Apilactobacillus timberlakei]